MTSQYNYLAMYRMNHPLWLIDAYWFNLTEKGRKMRQVCEGLDKRAKMVKYI